MSEETIEMSNMNLVERVAAIAPNVKITPNEDYRVVRQAGAEGLLIVIFAIAALSWLLYLTRTKVSQHEARKRRPLFSSSQY